MSDRRPLAGIRVFELGIAIAGPIAGRYLAAHGAEVIKVESRRNREAVRNGAGWIPPAKYGFDVWTDTGIGQNEYMAGKRSLGLDLKSPEGAEAAKRLLARCDIFLSNYTAPAVKSLGLDFESVQAVKPDIIYAEISGFGLTPSPYYSFLAWGPNQAPLTGIDDLTGWPDRPPTGTAQHSPPDYSNGLQGLVAILAALEHRDRTGEGQFIDLSQFEGTVALLGPLLLDYEINGRRQTRNGNRLPWAAPQGIYPCRGTECWVAISIFTDEEWKALCQVAGHSEWAEDSRFRTNRDRLANHDELDDLIAAWTRQLRASEVSEWLQRAGVPAAPVLDVPGIGADPQLAARDYWILADHARFGKDLATGHPIHLSETPGHIERVAPALGQDNDHVLQNLCEYTEAEVQTMVERGAVFPMADPEVKLERRYLSWIRNLMPHLPWPDPGATT